MEEGDALKREIEVLRKRLEEAEAAVRAGEARFEALTRSVVDAASDHEGRGVALRASEERYRRMIEHTSEGVWMYDAAGITTFMNARMGEMLGCRAADGVGMSIFAFMDESEVAAARERLERRLHGTPSRGEFRLRRLDGAELWISVHADPLRDAAGNVEASVVLATDVTERHRADEAKSLLAAVVEGSDDAILGTRLDGTVTFVNRRAEALFGYPTSELLGKSLSILVPNGRHGEDDAIIERIARGESVRHFETVRKRKDGSLVELSLSVSPIRDAEGRLVGISKIARDITDRRRAEETRSLLAAIVESSDDAILSTGLDDVIRSWNGGAERLTGYSAAEAVGRHVATLQPPHERVRLNAQREARSTLSNFETALLRKDGSVVEVSLSSSRIRDASGAPQGTSLIARDITERRKAEAAVRTSEEQLRHAQKMEAIGVLAGGVAHDFNNLLSVILGYTGLLLQTTSAADPLRRDIQEIQNAALRATELTRQLLGFSRKQILQPTIVNVNEAVLRIEKMLARLLGEDVELAILTAPLPCKVNVDPGQLEQVLMNLAVNARDAMPTGGNLTIETASVTLDESYAAEHVGVTAGRYVMLAVTDTGTGMDAATRARIFEPFFTTKEKAKGTGLGLATVYGIIQQSGGHIWVYSEPGRGTTFKIYLPQTDRDALVSLRPPMSAASVQGNETILLVEDEGPVRVVMRSILRRAGYHILEAQNGGEAFLMCEQFTAKIHLLLTDVVMPRMSGRQLADRLVELRPELKVLFVSGYTENTIVHHGVLDAGVEYLPKPIMPDALLQKVRQVLDSR